VVYKGRLLSDKLGIWNSGMVDVMYKSDRIRRESASAPYQLKTLKLPSSVCHLRTENTCELNQRTVGDSISVLAILIIEFGGYNS
jgi:hypothetical protein